MSAQIVTITQQELNKQLGVKGHTNPGMLERWAEARMAEIAAEAPATPFEVNSESPESVIASAHRDAKNIIDWLSIPGVALKYNLEAGYLIGLLKLCMESCTKEEAVTDIYLLVDYVRMAVGAGC